MTYQAPRTSERELIEIVFPSSVELIVLARFTAATVGARANFDLNEIDDLRLAVDELSVSFGPLDGDTCLRYEFVRDDDTVSVRCTREPTAGEQQGRPAHGGPSRLAARPGALRAAPRRARHRARPGDQLRPLRRLVDQATWHGDGVTAPMTTVDAELPERTAPTRREGAVRDGLVTSHLGLAHQLARRFCQPGRVPRRPRPGGVPGARQSGRSLRSRPRRHVQHLRVGQHHRRAQAALP